MGHNSRREKIAELFLKKKFYLSFMILLPLFFTLFALGSSAILLDKINSAIGEQSFDKKDLISIYNLGFRWTAAISSVAMAAGIAVAYSFLMSVRRLLKEGDDKFEEIAHLGKDFTEMAYSFRHYFSVLENISGGIIAIDRQGVIKMANRQAYNIFECSQKDFIGKNFTEKIGGIKEIIENVFENIAQSGDIIYKINGKEKIIGYTVSPIAGDKGVEGAVFSLKEITGIRQIHERIRQAERLASIGTLVRETAHEVRNPLAAIKGIVQMIGEDINEGNQKKSYIEAIMREIDRLNRVVDNLLEKGKSETVSIREILHRAVLLCSQNETWKDIRAIEEYDETLELSNIDERLNQAFYNVILNAFESVEKDGEVIVRAKSCDKKAVIEIISSSVMDKDIACRIFEEGFTTKAAGHGIGLKIALDTVKKAGGDIKVEPLKSSTKFSIILPAGE